LSADVAPASAAAANNSAVIPELTEQTLAAVRNRGIQIQIINGAGPAKTDVVFERVADLLPAEAQPEAIVASTFTALVAAELKWSCIEHHVEARRGRAPLDRRAETLLHSRFTSAAPTRLVGGLRRSAE
jgi:superfamily I DNA/RNA helicase